MHAEIVWDGGAWQVQDLGSRNGTFVDGRQLGAGEQATLESGVELIFGLRRNRYRLIDDSPPLLMAMTDSGEVRVGENDMLCLPAPENCAASIFRDLDGCFQLETRDGTRVIEDQELVVVEGRAWRLCLPSIKSRTQNATLLTELTLADVALAFFVSRDGEYVTMTLKRPSGELSLEPRAHAGLLLALARCRMEDAEQEHLPVSEHGWVHREDLFKMLGIDGQLLNLWVFRARRQLAAAGVRGAAAIVERRSVSQQMRIGLAHTIIHAA